MRTTLTIDDDLAMQLKDLGHRSGKTFEQVVNETLRAGLRYGRIAKAAEPYRLVPVAMGEVNPRFNLDKAVQLAAHLEDEEVVRKLRRTK